MYFTLNLFNATDINLTSYQSEALFIQTQKFCPVILLVLQAINVFHQLNPHLFVRLQAQFISQLPQLILGILPHLHPVLLLVPDFFGGQVLLPRHEGSLPLTKDSNFGNDGEHLKINVLGLHKTLHLLLVHHGLLILLVTLESKVASVTIKIPLVRRLVVTAATERSGLGIHINPTLGESLDCLTRSQRNLLVALHRLRIRWKRKRSRFMMLHLLLLHMMMWVPFDRGESRGQNNSIGGIGHLVEEGKGHGSVIQIGWPGGYR
mmetsp:Transcript_623/g.810  ORF Transcript_623/g.810 Transcript_623/m.810 type:complete len:263 (+) Transcript_623:30-818(+)